MNLHFGVPKRTKKEDPYKDQAILIMHQKPIEKNLSKRFELSNFAAEQMGYTEGGNIAVSFDGGKMYLAHLKTDIDEQYNLTKNNSFSNARVYDYVEKTFNLNTSDSIKFKLEEVETNEDSIVSVMEVIISRDQEENQTIDDDNREENTIVDEIDLQAEMQEEYFSRDQVIQENN